MCWIPKVASSGRDVSVASKMMTGAPKVCFPLALAAGQTGGLRPIQLTVRVVWGVCAPPVVRAPRTMMTWLPIRRPSSSFARYSGPDGVSGVPPWNRSVSPSTLTMANGSGCPV